jgi:hypothetical protein
MRAALPRILVVFVCLAFGFGLLGASAPAAAADKKKGWPSKKHHKATHHKSTKPAAKAAGASGGAAPAEEADEDDDDESASDDNKPEAKPKAQAASSKKADKKSEDEDDNDERQATKGKDDDDDEGASTVVRRKAKRPVMDEEGGAAPIAFELSAGPRVVHRSFSFYDPLSDHVATAVKPYAYNLPAAVAPSVDIGLYPAAFATRGVAASFGLVGHYEKVVLTKTTDPSGASFDTLAQQMELGLRARLPLGEHELGLTASGGQQAFHVSATDLGPAMGSTVPNVDYTFAGVGADARLRLAPPVELAAHVGTRFVFKTGDLAKQWFSTTKTTSIEAGLSIAYKLTPLFSVVGGVDFLRYGFDFNPVDPASVFVAGGAVDQYIFGFAALRVSVSGG